MTVYLIQVGERGPVKIGRSDRDPMDRLKNIQWACYDTLYLVGSMIETPGLEGQLHQYFARLRIKGEWFKYSGKLKAFIEQFPHDVHRRDAPLHEVKFYGRRLVVKRIRKSKRKN